MSDPSTSLLRVTVLMSLSRRELLGPERERHEGTLAEPVLSKSFGLLQRLFGGGVERSRLLRMLTIRCTEPSPRSTHLLHRTQAFSTCARTR